MFILQWQEICCKMRAFKGMSTSASTEGGSGPGQLLRSVCGCRLSGFIGRCSATWY